MEKISLFSQEIFFLYSWIFIPSPSIWILFDNTYLRQRSFQFWETLGGTLLKKTGKVAAVHVWKKRWLWDHDSVLFRQKLLHKQSVMCWCLIEVLSLQSLDHSFQIASPNSLITPRWYFLTVRLNMWIQSKIYLFRYSIN